MKIGDRMLMEGPKGRLKYDGFGDFTILKNKVLGKKKIGCISGGTGITPCYQVIQAALLNGDGTKCSLVFGNRTTNDILLKDELFSL
jgi:NAD(P)H-flavin reductase